MASDRYRTLGEVAAVLEVPRWRLSYLLDRGDIPDASLHVPGRRLFSEEDITNIRRALSRQQTEEPSTTSKDKGEDR